MTTRRSFLSRLAALCGAGAVAKLLPARAVKAAAARIPQWTGAVSWSSPATVTPLADILAVKEMAMKKYGKTLGSFYLQFDAVPRMSEDGLWVSASEARVIECVECP